MTNNEIQTRLGVADNDIIAYGYTYQRNSVDIYFEKGQLVRKEYDNTGQQYKVIELRRSDTFDSNFFFENIKRWYEYKTNAELIKLFDTFGSPLALTK